MDQQYLRQSFSYTVRRTRRKSIGIYVFRDGRVEVRTSKYTSKREIVAFVESETQWVLTRLSQLADLPTIKELEFISGASHYFLGQSLSLHLGVGKASVYRDNNFLTIKVPDPGEEFQVKELLRLWYRQQAKIFYDESVERLLPAIGDYAITKPKVKIRAMRTRWGSCSSQGNINLNLWLIRLPPELIDYVIAHELCHLVEFNHSSRFYCLLGGIMPDWRLLKGHIEQHPASGMGF